MSEYSPEGALGWYLSAMVYRLIKLHALTAAIVALSVAHKGTELAMTTFLVTLGTCYFAPQIWLALDHIAQRATESKARRAAVKTITEMLTPHMDVVYHHAMETMEVRIALPAGETMVMYGQAGIAIHPRLRLHVWKHRKSGAIHPAGILVWRPELGMPEGFDDVDVEEILGPRHALSVRAFEQLQEKKS